MEGGYTTHQLLRILSDFERSIVHGWHGVFRFDDPIDVLKRFLRYDSVDVNYVLKTNMAIAGSNENEVLGQGTTLLGFILDTYPTSLSSEMAELVFAKPELNIGAQSHGFLHALMVENTRLARILLRHPDIDFGGKMELSESHDDDDEEFDDEDENIISAFGHNELDIHLLLCYLGERVDLNSKSCRTHDGGCQNLRDYFECLPEEIGEKQARFSSNMIRALDSDPERTLFILRTATGKDDGEEHPGLHPASEFPLDCAINLFVLVVLVCDGYIKPRNTLAESPASASSLRFIEIAKRLPMELQAGLCRIAYDLSPKTITSVQTEPAFRAYLQGDDFAKAGNKGTDNITTSLSLLRPGEF